MTRTVPTTDDLSRVPAFISHNEVVRANISDNSALPDLSSEWKPSNLREGNLLTSKFRTAYGCEYHKPVIDIDFKAELIPSSTPGHFHLVLDKEVSWPAYEKVLTALYGAGIIQYGVWDNARRRKATSVRLPWIKKGNADDNRIASPEDEYRESLEAQIKALQKELDNLKDPF